MISDTIAPLHQYEATEVKDKPAIALLVTLSVAAFVTLIVILACFFYCKRRRDLLHYKGELLLLFSLLFYLFNNCI